MPHADGQLQLLLRLLLCKRLHSGADMLLLLLPVLQLIQEARRNTDILREVHLMIDKEMRLQKLLALLAQRNQVTQLALAAATCQGAVNEARMLQDRAL